MQKREINKILKIAEADFVNGNYSDAMREYSKLLSYEPNQQDAKIGVMLCDVAIDSNDKEQAQAIFDYYNITKIQSKNEAYERTEELIKSLDTNSMLYDTIFSEILNKKDETLDGLTYKEFKQICSENDDFKTTFEGIMFSTKIVIDNKSDLLNFIQDLLGHGYYDMALEYLEMASKVIKDDVRVQEIAKQLKVILNENRSK
jgi:tetratricopeptide (TPR) repeat protein